MRAHRVTVVTCMIWCAMSGMARADDAKAEAEKMSNAYFAAILAHDVPFLEQHWDAELQLIFGEGTILGKKDLLLAFEKATFAKCAPSDRSFRIVGDIVIETGILDTEGTRAGGEFNSHVRYASTWFKKGDKWLLTFGQESPIVEEPRASEVDAATSKELDHAIELWLLAFNQHNAKAVAAEYTVDADVRSSRGEQLVGRAAIEQDMSALFAKHPKVQTKISEVSRRAVAPTVVIEDGVWEEFGYSDPGQKGRKGRYSSVIVKQNGKWLVVHERGYEDIAEVNQIGAVGNTEAAKQAEQELLALEQEMAKAYVSRDRSLFEKHDAEELTIIDIFGDVYDKAKDREDFKSAVVVMEPIKLDELKARVFGESAVVTYRSAAKGSWNGRAFDLQLRTTDVFVHRDGRWQRVSSHACRIAEE